MGLVDPVIQISKPTQSIVSAEWHSHDPVFLMHRVVSYGLLCCAFTVHDKQKTTMEMPVLCKVTELFIHCHPCMSMQLILICSNCIRSSFPILLSNTIQACRIILIRYCRRCINTARNLGNHCNNLTSHLVKHTPKINLINAQITCIYMHAACIV